jgi:hypothetical protein
MVITDEELVMQGVVKVLDKEGFMQFHARCFRFSGHR